MPIRAASEAEQDIQNIRHFAGLRLAGIIRLRIMIRLLRIFTAAGACALMSVMVSAHDVVVEQIVQIAMHVTGDRLAVQMRVPVTALADGTLPRLPDGGLDASAIAGPLRIVAADAVRNVDVQQDGTSLPQLDFATRLSADRASVEVDINYAVHGIAGLSARLNTFEGKPLRPVRTIVEYIPATGEATTISVVGQPTRVALDPDSSPTVARFARQTLESILRFGDHLLLMICLVLPVRSARQTARPIGLMVIGQVIGTLAYISSPELLAPLAPAAAFIAASAVVLAALQVVVGARTSLVTALAAAFGILFGVGLGHGLVADLQLAGAHHALAIATLLLTLVVAQVWIGAILWAARSWLDGRGVPDYAVSLFFAVAVGHTALHHVMASSVGIGDEGSFLADHSIVLMTLAWAVATLAVARVDSLRSGSMPNGPSRLSDQSLT